MPLRTRRSRRTRRGLTLVVLLAVSIAVITLDYRGQAHGSISWAKRAAHDAFAPVQDAVDDVARPVGSFLAGAVHGSSLEDQNADLQREIGALRRQALAGQATRSALRELEILDNLPFAGGIPTVTARVTAFSPSDFAATIQLDRGTTSGVAVGMPVVGGAGLVGQVTETWSSGCTVRLVTDVDSSVGVRFGAHGDLALVQGAGLGKALAVNLVTPGTVLHKGEVLTTSGLQNAQFPPDIPVARVTSFSSTPSATQEAVKAAPLDNLSILQYVDVLQWQSAP